MFARVKNIVALLCMLGLCFNPVLSAASSDGTMPIVVATKTAPLKTKGMFKFSSRASRGQRWAVVKEKQGSVVLTWDPEGELAREYRQYGGKKLPQFTVKREEFEASFVPLSEWSKVTESLARKLQIEFPDLSLEECEMLVNGELWVGLEKKHVLAAIPRNRITEIDSIETIEGLNEVWRITSVSTDVLTHNAAKMHVTESVLLGEPQKSVDEHHADYTESGTVMILTMQDGVIIQIER